MNALELEPELKRAAGHQTRGRPELFDDVLQEMRVAVLLAPGGNSASWYLWRATWRAIDWLRRETRYHALHLPLEESLV